MQARFVRGNIGNWEEAEADKETEAKWMISFGWGWLWGVLPNRYFMPYSIPSKIIIILLTPSRFIQEGSISIPYEQFSPLSIYNYDIIKTKSNPSVLL